MLKFDLFSLKTEIPETKFFERLFGLMKTYHMNNILHNEVVKILAFVLETDEGASLIPNVRLLLFSCLTKASSSISCTNRLRLT